MSTRLDGFTGATRDALVLASAHGRLTVRRARSAWGSSRALSRRRSPQQVVEVERGAVGSHTAAASVLYQGLPAAERQRAHATLAELVDDPVAHARHLALSTERADAELACRARAGSTSCHSPGRTDRRGRVGEHAIRHTPAGDRVALARRIAAATRAHAVTGGIERARTLSEELLAVAPPGPARAEALALAAEVEGDYIGRAIELQREALAEPGAPAALCATLHRQLALYVRFREGMEPAEEHARAAVELAEEVGDDGLRAAALAGLALVHLNGGKAGSLRLAEQAAELAALSGEEPRAETDFTVAHVLLWSGELERARQLLEDRLRALARPGRAERRLRTPVPLGRGAPSGTARARGRVRGRISRARAPYTRPGEESPTTMFPSALIAAHRGDLARARRLAEEMVRLAELHETKLCGAPAMLGTVELWSGAADAALEWFSKAERIIDPADGAEPTMSWWRAEQARRCSSSASSTTPKLASPCGRRRRGDSTARGRWQRRCAVVVSSPPPVATSTRRSRSWSRRSRSRAASGRGRALLALGVARRRARQKRPAREAIEAACATFEELGAAGWAARARSSAASAAEPGWQGLTPAEQRVADLRGRAGRTPRSPPRSSSRSARLRAT